MKTFNLYLLLTVTLFCLTSCDDKDEHENFHFNAISGFTEPDKPISETNVAILVTKSVGINGGTAPFTVKVDNESIATASIINNQNDIKVSIWGVALGTTSLTVTDANGVSNQLKVEVVNRRTVYEINKVETFIEGTITDEDKKKLADKIIEKAEILETGSLELSYIDSNSGTMKIYKTYEDESPVEGTFSHDGSFVSNPLVLKCTYNKAEHTFYFEIWTHTWQLRKNLTADYVTEYPGISSAQILYIGGGAR